MGTLTSTQDFSGREINGITLGSPVINEDGSYSWNDGALPDGVIEVDGTIVVAAG